MSNGTNGAGWKILLNSVGWVILVGSISGTGYVVLERQKVQAAELGRAKLFMTDNHSEIEDLNLEQQLLKDDLGDLVEDVDTIQMDIKSIQVQQQTANTDIRLILAEIQRLKPRHDTTN